ncbi:MAG: hypothetical protein EBR94_00725 [Bacteroidetes bacterium]|nr:hypothetical protein [Bacteroidota bacterium]
MATFSKIALSGSTDGRMIKVAATATAGTTLHTGSTTATTFDALVVRAFAATANVINIAGYVNRITA